MAMGRSSVQSVHGGCPQPVDNFWTSGSKATKLGFVTEPMTENELQAIVSLYAASWPDSPTQETTEQLVAGLRPFSYQEARNALPELTALHISRPSILDVMAQIGQLRRHGPTLDLREPQRIDP